MIERQEALCTTLLRMTPTSQSSLSKSLTAGIVEFNSMLLLVDLFLNLCYIEILLDYSHLILFYILDCKSTPIGSDRNPHDTTSSRINETMKLLQLPQTLYDESMLDCKPQLVAQRVASSRVWCMRVNFK